MRIWVPRVFVRLHQVLRTPQPFLRGSLDTTLVFSAAFTQCKGGRFPLPRGACYHSHPHTPAPMISDPFPRLLLLGGGRGPCQCCTAWAYCGPPPYKSLGVLSCRSPLCCNRPVFSVLPAANPSVPMPCALQGAEAENPACLLSASTVPSKAQPLLLTAHTASQAPPEPRGKDIQPGSRGLDG